MTFSPLTFSSVRFKNYYWRFPKDYDGPMHKVPVEGEGPNPSESLATPWIPCKTQNKQWERKQRLARKASEFLVPSKFKEYDEEFAQIVDLETQLKGLESRGFLRAYKPYDPPSNAAEIFMSVCSDVLDGFDAGKRNDLKSFK